MPVADARAVGNQNFAQPGDAAVGAVQFDEACFPQPPAPIASLARKLDHPERIFADLEGEPGHSNEQRAS
jgi:hypothetical protein